MQAPEVPGTTLSRGAQSGAAAHAEGRQAIQQQLLQCARVGDVAAWPLQGGRNSTQLCFISNVFKMPIWNVTLTVSILLQRHQLGSAWVSFGWHNHASVSGTIGDVGNSQAQHACHTCVYICGVHVVYVHFAE